MFPFVAGGQNFWGNAEEESSGREPLNRIDRALTVRSRRLVIGVAVDQEFSQIQGALLAATGHGKHMRVDFVSELSVAIPAAIGKNCRCLGMDQDLDLASLVSAAADLGEIQAVATQKLMTQAGKYLDGILAVAVTDPGVYANDFDGQSIQMSISNPAIIAERSGLNVIDAFPAQDIQVGGDGSDLEALPLWLLLADRSQKVSRFDRILVDFDSGTAPKLYFIPASDGKDNEVPNLQVFYYDGKQFARSSLMRQPSVSEIRAGKASGKSVFDIESSIDCRQVWLACNQCVHAIRGCLPLELFFFTGKRQGAEIERMMADWELGAFKSDSGLGNGDPQQFLPAPRWLDWADQRIQSVTAITTAVLGLMHIDQMPANLPWLTGGSKLRILGRLTPGRPSAWRNLIRTMADLHPPTMKLKDAV